MHSRRSSTRPDPDGTRDHDEHGGSAEEPQHIAAVGRAIRAAWGRVLAALAASALENGLAVRSGVAVGHHGTKNVHDDANTVVSGFGAELGSKSAGGAPDLPPTSPSSPSQTLSPSKATPDLLGPSDELVSGPEARPKKSGIEADLRSDPNPPPAPVVPIDIAPLCLALGARIDGPELGRDEMEAILSGLLASDHADQVKIAIIERVVASPPFLETTGEFSVWGVWARV